MQDIAQAGYRFRQVDDLLRDNQYLWRPQPFTHLILPWEQQHPELAQWLRRRTLQQAEQQHLQPWLLDAPEPFATLAKRCLELSLVPQLELQQPPDSSALPRGLEANIPGRKLEQIHAFTQAMAFAGTPKVLLDWCGGKGYLSRYLARPGRRVECLEWQAGLCADGSRECHKLGLEVAFHQFDALGQPATQLLARADTWVALHACGDLHTHLLRQAGRQQVQRLAISPCCYNKIAAENYQPLSQAGRQSALRLDKQDLGLALKATVTAGARDKRLRDQSMAWRLGFDLLQRRTNRQGGYLPVPSSASKWLQLDFADWCRQVARLREVALPPVTDWELAEQAGWDRLAQVRNLELVAALFRRPLEIWLLLDQLQFLHEHGFAVRMGSFCTPGLTPRNLALLAERAI